MTDHIVAVMGIESWQDAAAAVGVVSALIGVVAWGVTRIVQQVQHAIVTHIDRSLEPILWQLTTNGGASLRDAVERVEEGQEHARRERAEIFIRIDELDQLIHGGQT